MLIEVIVCGLTSRKFSYLLPDFVNTYLGDALWALMIYVLCSLLFSHKSRTTIVFISIIFCFSIEFSQLYHAPWIDKIRANTLGGLILGYGFLYSDLIAYSIGVLFGYSVEKLVQSFSKKTEPLNC